MGVPAHDGAGLDAGAAFVYEKVGELWEYRDTLFASDANSGDAFGWSVAINGTTIVIGAKGDDEYGINAGAAYVFRRYGARWIEEVKLSASDAQFGAEFGTAIAIQGTTILVGAPKHQLHGSTYVFRESTLGWHEAERLLVPEDSDIRFFGSQIEMDGRTAIVATGIDIGNGIGNSISIHEFLLNETKWEWQGIVTTMPGSSPLAFAGDTIVIGSVTSRGLNSGSAIVMKRFGANWYVDQVLHPTGSAPYAEFGGAVDIQGDTIVVGAPDWRGDGRTSAQLLYFVVQAKGNGLKVLH